MALQQKNANIESPAQTKPALNNVIPETPFPVAMKITLPTIPHKAKPNNAPSDAHNEMIMDQSEI